MSGGSYAELRALAEAAGDRHRVELRQLLTASQRVKGDDHLMARSLVTQLQEDQLVTAAEAEQLGRIVDALHDDSDLASAAAQVESLYSAITKNPEAGPIAIAIAGVGRDSINAATEGAGPDVETVAKEKSKKGTAAVDLAGALTGGNIGSKGGLWGGIIGAVVGGAGASYLASKDQEGDDDDDGDDDGGDDDNADDGAEPEN